MKTIILTLCAILPPAILTGCTSVIGNKAAQSFDMAASAYYHQDRTAEVFLLKGAKKINIEGEDITFQLNSVLPPLSILPKDPNNFNSLVNGVESLGRIGLGVWGLDRVTKNTSYAPQVVEVRPEIVKPTVIQTR